MSGRYWDVSWNPVVGCSHASTGCVNCWAEKLAASRLAHLPEYRGLTENGQWTGEVRCLPERLNDPLRWHKPRRVFVALMSDLYHGEIPPAFRRRVFESMKGCPQHTFLVCTKRISTARGDGQDRPNAWFGWTIEHQLSADAHLPVLRGMVAVKRWVSVEPLLGPIEADWYGIDWVVVGCESGPNRRPCRSDWIHSIVAQCHRDKVPVWVKQWSANGRVCDGELPQGYCREMPRRWRQR